MLQLTQTEIYSTRSTSFLNSINNAIRQKLSMNIGVIRPEHIEIELLDLKKYAKTKSASSPVLLDALTLYENMGGRIQLFDLSSLSSNGSDIPPFIPFLPGMSKVGMLNETQKPMPAIFMNMYRMGNWSIDDKSYENLFAITDLQTCLESGYIAYKMIIEKKADAVLNNPIVLEYLTRIYTKLFYDALIKVPGNLPLLDFQQEAAKFIIAKFFLVYVLQKNENDDLINNYARLASNSNSSTKALQAYEENLGINYEKLSLFLSSFGIVFFNGNPTTIADFERAWIFMYGEGLALAVEFVPYFIHFLFAPTHASRLGGSTKLDNRLPALQKEGLPKLYNAIIGAVMR